MIQNSSLIQTVQTAYGSIQQQMKEFAKTANKIAQSETVDPKNLIDLKENLRAVEAASEVIDIADNMLGRFLDVCA